jgi:hypothetical protein
VRALGAGQPSPMNEPLDLSFAQCNRRAAQTLPAALAMKLHPPGRRRTSRLFLHGRRHGCSSMILNYPSRALSRAPLLGTDNIKASLRWKPSSQDASRNRDEANARLKRLGVGERYVLLHNRVGSFGRPLSRPASQSRLRQFSGVFAAAPAQRRHPRLAGIERRLSTRRPPLRRNGGRPSGLRFECPAQDGSSRNIT